MRENAYGWFPANTFSRPGWFARKPAAAYGWFASQRPVTPPCTASRSVEGIGSGLVVLVCMLEPQCKQFANAKSPRNAHFATFRSTTLLTVVDESEQAFSVEEMSFN